MSWFGFGSKTTVVADSESAPEELKYEPISEAEFDKFLATCEDYSSDWSKAFEDKDKEMTVWTKRTDVSPINMVKARVLFRHIEPELIYDVINDHEYRKTWDDNMIEGHSLREIDSHNTIGYYAIRLPTPLSHRDFVNQRGWTARRSAVPPVFIICNNSVLYPPCPEKSGFVRAWSFRSGYVIRKIAEGGTEFTYCTLSDPKGWLPAWVINMAVSVTGPKLVQKMTEVIPKYPEWVKENRPDGNKRPWLTPPSSPIRDAEVKEVSGSKSDEKKEERKEEAPASLTPGEDKKSKRSSKRLSGKPEEKSEEKVKGGHSLPAPEDDKKSKRSSKRMSGKPEEGKDDK